MPRPSAAVHVALLRAVNVGGTGKLPMAELRALCAELGFAGVRTYIQSGNVVFAAPGGERGVKERLARALAAHMGKPIGVLVRSRAELEDALARVPFPGADPRRVLVVFLDEAPPPDALDGLATPGGEEVALSGREAFIHFPDGMGRSKLKVPFAAVGTGRNLNTVAALAALAREVEEEAAG